MYLPIYKFSKLYKKTKTKIIAGLYFANKGFWGNESRNFSQNKTLKQIGFQGGIEQNIWKNKILFQGDLISGQHKLGQIVLGGAYCFTQKLILSSGIQIPFIRSKAEKAFVIELTYLPISND